MKTRIALTISLTCFAVLTAVAQSPTMTDMNTRLRAEEANNSKIMWIMHEITDVHGPRVTGSPGLRDAQDWAVATMKSWGLVNVKLEPWNFNHQGWQNYELQANVLKPFQQPLNVRAVAWTPGTKGMLPTLKPRLARYMPVGVLDVRETPTRTMSDLLMVSRDWPSSCCMVKCMASIRSK